MQDDIDTLQMARIAVAQIYEDAKNFSRGLAGLPGGTIATEKVLDDYVKNTITLFLELQATGEFPDLDDDPEDGEYEDDDPDDEDYGAAELDEDAEQDDDEVLSLEQIERDIERQAIEEVEEERVFSKLRNNSFGGQRLTRFIH